MSKCDYPIAVSRETLSDGSTVYYLWHPGLTGCAAQGETLEIALDELRSARRLYQQSLIEDGLPIPPAHVEYFDDGATYYISVEC